MEKRFLLATIISVLILAFWSAIFPAKQPKPPQPLISQNIENNKVIENKPTSTSLSLVSSSALLPSAFEEKIEKIETPRIIVEFSNIGGMIRKVFLREYDTAIPVYGMGGAPAYGQLEFILERLGAHEIIYRHEASDLVVRRTYTVSADDYSIEVQTTVQNRDNMSKLIIWKEHGVVLDMSNLDKENGAFTHDRSLFEYVVSSASGIERKSNAFKFTEKERKDISVNTFWAGFRSRYFCIITKPIYEARGHSINPLKEKELQVNISAAEMELAPGAIATFSSLIFVGPEKSDLLAKYKSGFEEIKRYYRAALFDAIAKIIDSILHGIYKVVRNWGVAIVLVSVIIYLAMYPLTMRSMASMRKMQELQPKVATLREKYRDNPQKMNIEVMELYKKHKINPLGGCLPMLLQMPVFIGLYQVLWRSVSFKGADFLWIKDLSEPDRLFILPFSLPFIGNEINLLPVLMIAVMAVQQKLTEKNMGNLDPAQAAQQKMMVVIMPIFLGAIFYHFASGLTLYFTLFYAFSTLAQWKMSTVQRVT